MGIGAEKWPASKEDFKYQRQETKLQLQKQKIKQTIYQARMVGYNPIAGYNLSAHHLKKK